MAYAIETIDLVKRYPVHKSYREIIFHPLRKKEIIALDGISLQVNEGELLGLLGPNGAGKTTFLKILSTLVIPTAGKAYVNGLDLEKDGKKIRKAIGYVVSDERSFYWRLTGRQNLRFFGSLNNLKPDEIDKKINELFELTELNKDGERLFKGYSTGMKQRLSIARGMLTNPQVLFMDEPTKSLDPKSARQLCKFIQEKIVTEMGHTVLFATHNLEEAEEICHRIAILLNGRIKAIGTPEKVKNLIGREKIYLLKIKAGDFNLREEIDKIEEVTEIYPISWDPTAIKIKTMDISTVIKKIIQSNAEIVECSLIKTSLEEAYTHITREKD